MFIEKHDTVSRLVTAEDLPVVVEACKKMLPLLFTPIGLYKGFFAIAHPQIEKERPLRFFMLNTTDLNIDEDRIVCVVNPVILQHTSSTIESNEGCATFSKMPMAKVERWNKCTVEYSKIYLDKNDQPTIGHNKKTVNLSGKAAKVFQHEIDHLNAKYIY